MHPPSAFWSLLSWLEFQRSLVKSASRSEAGGEKIRHDCQACWAFVFVCLPVSTIRHVLDSQSHLPLSFTFFTSLDFSVSCLHLPLFGFASSNATFSVSLWISGSTTSNNLSASYGCYFGSYLILLSFLFYLFIWHCTYLSKATLWFLKKRWSYTSVTTSKHRSVPAWDCENKNTQTQKPVWNVVLGQIATCYPDLEVFLITKVGQHIKGDSSVLYWKNTQMYTHVTDLIPHL